MNLSTRPEIPAWLSKSESGAHLNFVIRTLARREAMRHLVRQSSHQSETTQPSSPSSPYPLSSPSPNLLTSHYSVAVGCQHENRRRNRYLDILPYDRTRVIVGPGLEGLHNDSRDESTEGKGKHKYLNASWVLERSGHKWWIATQAPLPNTAHALLSIILQPMTRPPPSLCPSISLHPRKSRIRTVVQLTQNVENGHRKAHAYFPNDVGKSLIVFPDNGDSTPTLKVTLIKIHWIEEAHCIQSIVSIIPVTRLSSKNITEFVRPGDDREGEDDFRESQGEEPIIFQHMLYTSWPDQGVPGPADRESLLAFVQLVDSTNRDLSFASYPNDPELDPDPPILVGCSAGVGRTGSFIALCSLLRAHGILPPPFYPTPATSLPPSPLGPLPPLLEEDLVAQEVDSLREQRPSMVQRDEQLLLVYEILTTALESKNQGS